MIIRQVVFAQSNTIKKPYHPSTDITCYHCGKQDTMPKIVHRRPTTWTTVGDETHDNNNENGSDKHIFHQTGGDNLKKD